MAIQMREEEEENPFGDFNFSDNSFKDMEEENPFADFEFGAGEFSGGDFDAGSFSGKGSNSLGYSFDRAMKAGGRGLSDLLPRMGLYVPQGIQDYSAKLQEAGETGMEDYAPEYAGEITQQSLKDVPGFLGEKLAENATAMGITMFGLTLGQSLMKGPGVSKVIGAGITGATFGFNYLMLLDEAVETHAAAAGKTVDELTESEIGNASFTAIQNAGLDFILPGIWARSMNKAGLPAKKSLKELAKNLKATDKEKIGSMLYKGAKQTLKSSLIEGGIESAQQANMMRTSVLGTAGINPESMLTDFAVGAAGGGLYGTPASISEATSVNRSRKADKFLLDFDDYQKKVAASDKYLEDVAAYEKEYDSLVKQFDSITKAGKKGTEYGPLVGNKDFTIDTINKLGNLSGTNKPFNLNAVKGKIAPPIKDIDANVADIIPELWNAQEDAKGVLGNIKDAIADLTLRRSSDMLKDIPKDVQTGKQMAAFLDVQSSIVDTESSSGKTQGVSKSFDTLRHKYIGDYVNKFEKIKNKWTRHVPLSGEMFGNVRPAVNRYIAAKLEEKNERPLYNLAEAESEVISLLGNSKKLELDKDIQQIAKIQDNIWTKLSKVLGKDGLSIGHQKGYLTRGIDYKAAKRNPEGFKLSLKNDVGLSTEQAEQVLNNVLNDVDPNVYTSEQIRAGLDQTEGLGPSPFEQTRTGSWDNLSTEFRNQDTLNSIERYLFSGVTRIASAEAFGGDKANKYNSAIKTLKDSGILNDSQTEKLWGIYDAYHNVYKKPRNEKQRALVQGMKGLSTVTAISYLGLATISSWTEPMWIGQRVGWYNMLKAAPIISGYALKGLANSIYGGSEGKSPTTAFGKDLLRVMGMALNPAMSERIDKLMAGDRNITLNYFFRSPGAMWLTQYTNFVRVWTAAAGLHMIQNQLNKVNSMNKTNRALLESELRENGMSMEDFKKIGSLANGDIRNSILDDNFLDSTFTNSKGNEISVRDVMIPWMRKITTDVALEPTGANRPLWMSDPNMLLLAQLKSFPILFGNTIARRLNAKMNPQICSPDLVGRLGTISAISAAVGMAALAMAVKDAIKGVEEDRGIMETVSAVGVPLIGEISDSKIGGYIVGPGPALVDNWIKTATGGNPFGDTAEEIFKLFLNTTTGRIGSEAFMGDR